MQPCMTNSIEDMHYLNTVQSIQTASHHLVCLWCIISSPWKQAEKVQFGLTAVRHFLNFFQSETLPVSTHAHSHFIIFTLYIKWASMNFSCILSAQIGLDPQAVYLETYNNHFWATWDIWHPVGLAIPSGYNTCHHSTSGEYTWNYSKFLHHFLIFNKSMF
jgi:hypothetical protein